MSKVEKYISDNNITGRIADALLAYDKGYNTLGHICNFYNVNIDIVVSHVLKIVE